MISWMNLLSEHTEIKRGRQEVSKGVFLKNIRELKQLSTEEMLERRYKHVTSVGAFSE